MTCNILNVGHIKCLKKLSKKGEVTVGLLTTKALKGYKKERMPFRDRKYILESLNLARVVPQDSLDPTSTLKKYKCKAMASGDGWEPKEVASATKLGIKLININSGEKLRSSHI